VAAISTWEAKCQAQPCTPLCFVKNNSVLGHDLI
jgi:hypothetical protein